MIVDLPMFVTCACGRRCRMTTYNRKFCSVRCRRAAERAQARVAQATNAAVWDEFWNEVGDVPLAATVADDQITKVARR
jgi:hypothetical protein